MRLATDHATAALADAPPQRTPPQLSERPLVVDAAPAEDAAQVVTYLMLFRVAVATMLMLSVVAVAIMLDTVDTLAGPFGRFVFALLATTYVATLAYALSIKRLRDPVRF